MDKKVSIIILTKNQEKEIKKCLKACINQDYDKRRIEIVVVSDGSGDRTVYNAMSFKKVFKNLKVLDLPWIGRVKAENIGIKNAKMEYVVLLNADCIPEKRWLKNLMNGFDENTVMVSSFSSTGGTSTAFKKDVFRNVGYFDEDFNELGTGYRDDTEFTFRLWEMGFKTKTVKAEFKHIHEHPKGIGERIKYAIYRLSKHKFDPLLYKKHPKLTRKFFDIKIGFIRNPFRDFDIATGRWKKRGLLELSSPQGIVLMKNKTIIHLVIIIVLAWLYVFLVKLFRFYGSLKFKKLLI